jgi:hypothetical protein
LGSSVLPRRRIFKYLGCKFGRQPACNFHRVPEKEITMKNTLTRTMMIAAVALGAAGAAWAQTSLAQAKIPFAFQVNSLNLPAGEYTIERSAASNTALIFRGARGQVAGMTGTTSALYLEEGNPRLIFRCVENGCVLSDLWTGTKGYHWAAPARYQEPNARIAVVYIGRSVTAD